MAGVSHIAGSLRDFQLSAADATSAAWDRGITSVLNVLPTGTGKTRVAAELHARHDGSPSMFLVPKDELLDQSLRSFRKLIPGQTVEPLAQLGSLSADVRKSTLQKILSANIVIAMVQSLRNVLEEIPRRHFGMIGTDECHHGVANTYARIFRHFAPGAYRQYGLTATPERSDGIELFNAYQTTAFEMSIIEAVSNGWLVWPHQHNIPIREFDLRYVSAFNGELHGGELARILRRPGLLEKVIDHTLRIADGRKAAFYCHRKNISLQIHEILNSKGIKNYYIDESTPKGFRKSALEEFCEPSGCNVLSSVNALAEGFDCPLLEVIAFLCPTGSVGTLKQKFGRLTRPFHPPQAATPAERLQELAQQGKRAVFLDFVGACGQHMLASSADALDETLGEDERRMIKRMADAAGGPVDMRLIVAAAKQEVQNLRSGASTAVKLLSDREILKAYMPHPFDVLQIPLANAEPNSISITTESLARLKASLLEHGMTAEECRALTPPQTYVLQMELTVRKKEGLCSWRQAVTLFKFGYEVGQMRSVAATNKTTQIKRNGWQRPTEDGENQLLKRLKGSV